MTIIDGIPEPQLGDREKKEQDDLEYNKPLKKPLSETKDELKGLFGSFDPEKNNSQMQEILGKDDNISENKEFKENKIKMDENPKSPLIDAFVKQKLLKEKEGDLVKNSLINSGSIEDNIINIEGLENNKKEQLIESINYLEGEDAKTICKKNFNNDFSDKIEGLKEKVEGSKKGEKNLSLRNKELVDLLGENYFSLWNSEGKKETNKEALDKSFNITVNKIIDGKQFTRTESFESALIDIRGEGDFEDKFRALKYIDSLVQTSVGGKGKKLNKSFNKIRGEHIEKKKDYLDFKINQLERQIQETNDQIVKINLTKNLEKLEKQRDIDDFKGDIFEGGKNDKISDQNEKNSENK